MTSDSYDTTVNLYTEIQKAWREKTYARMQMKPFYFYLQ